MRPAAEIIDHSEPAQRVRMEKIQQIKMKLTDIYEATKHKGTQREFARQASYVRNSCKLVHIPSQPGYIARSLVC